MKLCAKENHYLLSVQIKECMFPSIVIETMNFDEVFHKVVKFEEIIIKGES